MTYDDGMFDLRQVEAITSDLRMLCQDMADRLRASDPAAALEFAEGLRTRKITADTFVEKFRDDIVGRLDHAGQTRTFAANGTTRRAH